MMTSLVLGAALAAPGAPVPADADTGRPGPAPWLLYLKPDENGRAQVLIYKNQKVTTTRVVTEVVDGKQVTKHVSEESERLMASYVLLDGLSPAPSFTTAAGQKLTHEAVMKRAKGGLVVLVSADGKPVSRNWLRPLNPETVIIAAEGLASPVSPRAAVAVPTLAPRMLLLGTGDDGKVQVAYNPGTNNSNNGYYDNFGRGGKVIFLGGNAQPVLLNEDGSYSNYNNGNPTAGVAPTKALDDTTFDAYDLSGKRISKPEVLKQLKAGGLVVVAGDNSLPDASYLKIFRSDLIVLVTPELINVPYGSKATKPTATARPAAPAPVRLIARPALQALPLKVAPPPVEKK